MLSIFQIGNKVLLAKLHREARIILVVHQSRSMIPFTLDVLAIFINLTNLQISPVLTWKNRRPKFWKNADRLGVPTTRRPSATAVSCTKQGVCNSAFGIRSGKSELNKISVETNGNNHFVNSFFTLLALPQLLFGESRLLHLFG